MKQTNKKMLETRKLQAGRTKPEHKNGGGDSRSNARLVCPDYCGLTRLSVSREAPVAPGVAASATATQANSQPQGAPGKGVCGGTSRNSLYESVLLNQ